MDRAVKRQARDRGALGHQAGLSAELRVARAYEARGCTVLQRRWRGAAGEIDLILRDGEALIFVEVKKSRSFARAAERLSIAQMHRIAAAAAEFLGSQPRGQLTDMRIDVALVDGSGEVRLLENAFAQS